MITGLYASILSLLFIGLSLNVIRWRRHLKVLLGDGGEATLKQAIAAQANASQYIPIGLLLLLLAELNVARAWLLHLAGVLFVSGRCLHGYALLKGSLKKRVLSMQLTVWVMVALAMINLLLFINLHLFEFT